MPVRKNKAIALTGGLGSGKSTALALFKKKGAVVFDADRTVHKLLSADSSARADVLGAFGTLNRRKLAQEVFSSIRKRRRLEKILHPRVRKALGRTIQKARRKIVVCDIPLLFETGWAENFEKVIVVNAPLNLRLKRLRKRGLRKNEALRRMKAQWPLDRKLKKADIVIDNSGSKQHLEKQIQNIWRTYGIARRKSKNRTAGRRTGRNRTR